MRHVPDFYTQRDGATCWTRNCWAAVGSILADASSGGRRTPSPTQFRAFARVPNCLPGGLADMMRGLMAMGLWGRCKLRNDVPKDELRAMLMRRSGAVVALETDFQDWPEGTVCQPDFNDRPNAYHSIAVLCGGGTGRQQGCVRVGNPLCMDWRWVDVDDVVHAVMVYNREHFETPGTADCIVVLPPQED